jgi:hypothetical protein
LKKRLSPGVIRYLLEKRVQLVREVEDLDKKRVSLAKEVEEIDKLLQENESLTLPGMPVILHPGIVRAHARREASRRLSGR